MRIIPQRNALLSSLLAIPLVACVTADVMHLDQQSRTPKNFADVQVFLDEPTRPYKAIAIVQASDQGWELSLDTLKTKMIEKAAALGADAVILGQQTNQAAGTYFMPMGNAFYGVNISAKMLAGKVIVFTSNVTTSATPAPVPSEAVLPAPFKVPAGLRVGMSFAEIEALQGPPAKRFSFESTTRWDYDDVIVIFDDGRAARFLPPNR